MLQLEHDDGGGGGDVDDADPMPSDIVVSVPAGAAASEQPLGGATRDDSAATLVARDDSAAQGMVEMIAAAAAPAGPAAPAAPAARPARQPVRLPLQLPTRPTIGFLAAAGALHAVVAIVWAIAMARLCAAVFQVQSYRDVMVIGTFAFSAIIWTLAAACLLAAARDICRRVSTRPLLTSRAKKMLVISVAVFVLDVAALLTLCLSLLYAGPHMDPVACFVEVWHGVSTSPYAVVLGSAGIVMGQYSFGLWVTWFHPLRVAHVLRFLCQRCAPRRPHPAALLPPPPPSRLSTACMLAASVCGAAGCLMAVGGPTRWRLLLDRSVPLLNTTGYILALLGATEALVVIVAAVAWCNVRRRDVLLHGRLVSVEWGICAVRSAQACLAVISVLLSRQQGVPTEGSTAMVVILWDALWFYWMPGLVALAKCCLRTLRQVIVPVLRHGAPPRQ